MGAKVPTDPNMTPEVRRFLETEAGKTAADLGALTATDTITDFISGLIKAATAKDYRIIEKIPYAATLTQFTAKTASGTVTATLKINSTAVTTGAINVTSSAASVTPTALNVTASGDALVLTASSISSPVDLSFTVKFTRALA